MLGRPNAAINSTPQPMQPGYRLLDGRAVSAIDGDNQAITLAAIIAGIVNRTGTTANTADTLPTVTSICAALPSLVRGDSFAFSIRMANAHTNTLTLGTGMTAVGTVNIVASNIRDYLLTLTSDNKQTVIIPCSTSTVTPRVLTGFTAAQIASIGIGMAVTGTGIGASAKVVAINLSNLSVTVDVDSTATADNIAVTFTPQMNLFGNGTRAI